MHCSLSSAGKHLQPAEEALAEYGLALLRSRLRPCLVGRATFPYVPILLCRFHVAQAWKTHLASVSPEDRRQIWDRLQAMVHLDLGPLASDAQRKAAFVTMLQQFEADWGERQSKFVSYFRKEWGLKPGAPQSGCAVQACMMAAPVLRRHA